MLRGLSVCLFVVLVGVFLIYNGRFAAFLVELLFSFVTCYMCSPVEHYVCFYFIFFLYEIDPQEKKSFRRCPQ